MWRIFNMLMDQAGDGGAGDGGAGDGNPGADGAGDKGGAAGQDPANQSKDGAGEKQFTLNTNGVIEKVSEAELISRAQRNGSLTQREQKISKQERTLAKNIAESESIIKELEGKKADGEQLTGGEEEALKEANDKRFESLEASDRQRTLDAAFAPIKTQYPDLNPQYVLDEFIKRVESGVVDDNQKGFMSVAEDMNKSHSGNIDKKLEDMLNDPENPTVKAHNDKIRKELIDGKRKLYNASGANGGAGGSGSSDKPIESISDAATRARREG